jgi:1,2-diacylglycerol 3-alpha-glucosyltransferase
MRDGPSSDTQYRIAMVAASPFPYPQGSQVLVHQLAAALHRRGHSISLVTYHHGIGREPEGIDLRRIRALPGVGPAKAGPSWQKPMLDLLVTRELMDVVRRSDVDVVHAHNVDGLLAALAVRRSTGIPVVYHIHNAMGLELHTYFQSRAGRWLGGIVGRWVDAHLPRRADCCLVLSPQAADYFTSRGAKRVKVVPPGIDFESGNSDRGQRLVGDGPFVLYSGNLDRYQDLDLLLHAFRLVVNGHSDVRLVLSTHAEPGKLYAQVRALGLEQDVVFIVGDDFGTVRDLMAAANVAVCPRTSCLGFPIKLLNYMAAGKAIVASEGSACGLRHLESGWVVEDGDATGMATAILSLLDDPALAQRLGESARRTVRLDYTWDRAAATIEDAYRHVQRSASPHRFGR